MRCESFTLTPGDVLYMPKSIVHFATTNSNQTSAHLTVSIERKGRTWEDMARRACAVTGSPACAAVEALLAQVVQTADGLPWYQLASVPAEGNSEAAVCARFGQLLLGFEAESLASQLERANGLQLLWTSKADVLTVLRRMAACEAGGASLLPPEAPASCS
jgi:hypothetical protein